MCQEVCCAIDNALRFPALFDARRGLDILGCQVPRDHVWLVHRVQRCKALGKYRVDLIVVSQYSLLPIRLYPRRLANQQSVATKITEVQGHVLTIEHLTDVGEHAVPPGRVERAVVDRANQPREDGGAHRIGHDVQSPKKSAPFLQTADARSLDMMHTACWQAMTGRASVWVPVMNNCHRAFLLAALTVVGTAAIAVTAADACPPRTVFFGRATATDCASSPTRGSPSPHDAP